MTVLLTRKINSKITPLPALRAESEVLPLALPALSWRPSLQVGFAQGLLDLSVRGAGGSPLAPQHRLAPPLSCLPPVS